MDIRLLIDGGASPQAPPGKMVESPPPKEEFEKTLQTARKEETPGEVAEKEPNAQLQKLDSEKKATGKDLPDATPTQIDPAILAQLQLVGVAAITPPIEPVNENLPVCPVNHNLGASQSLNGGAGKFIALANGVAKFAGPALSTSETKVDQDGTVPVLDATANATLSDMISRTFANAVNTKPDTTSTQPKPAIQVPTLVANADVQAKLNITDVQAVTQQPTIVARAVVASDAKPNVVNVAGKDIPNTPKPAVSVTEVNVVAAEAGQRSDTQDSDSKEKSKDDTQAPVAEVKAQQATADVVKPVNENTDRKLTSTERQAMVDTISKRIDELAVKSVRNEVRVEMHPPELGSVVVNIRKDLAGLTATLEASNEPLRQALHESRNDLAGTLTDRNVGQVRIEVRGASADTMNMGQQFNQSQTEQQNQQNQAKQNAFNASRMVPETKDSNDQPAPRRTQTTLLDMEI